MKNKKTVLAIISVIAVVLVIIGATYAYWLVTKTQNKENVISSACLDIAITGEKNDIELTEQYPISDDEGKALTPYEFTVTNKCNQKVDYQVALEAIGTESAAVNADAIKVALDDSVSILSSNKLVDTTVEGAYKSYRLTFGTLTASGTEGASVTYKLRLWIDKDASIDEMNKTFTSKISVTIGQGITNPLKPGTLAYSILSNNGGTEEIQTLSYDWIEGTYADETYLSMSKSTSYYWGTELDFNEINAKYKLGGTVVKATVEECRNGQKSDGTAITCSYTMKESDDAESLSSFGFKVTSLTNSSKADTSNTLYITIQRTGTASNNFSKNTTASEAGLYKTQDDLGDSYYFRGNTNNNYVKFGTYAEDTTLNVVYLVYDEDWGGYVSGNKTIEVKAGTPMYWRIMRINGDGSIRLVYDGTEKVANGTSHTATIGKSEYNLSYNDAKYAGYTYDVEGMQTNSTIKGVVDSWYEANLEKNYEKYIEDGIFCNDKQVTSSDEYSQNFAPLDRLGANKRPVLTCANKADRYTVTNTKGNALLKNPVGLLTADEVIFAGGQHNASSKSYYLYSGEVYWTSSPDYIEEEYLYIIGVADEWVDYDMFANSQFGVRPVINLKADVAFTGDGSFATPYEIASE